MLRRIVHLAPKADENYVAWHRRCVAVGRRFFETIMEFEPATMRLLKKIHQLSKAVKLLAVPCGDYDVPVQCHTDGSYMLPAAVYFKSARWWTHRRARHSALGTLHLEEWRHANVGAPQTRFDDVHVDFQKGKDWVASVHNDNWSTNFKEFALFAHKNVKAPVPECLQPKMVNVDHVEDFKSEPRPQHLWKLEKPWLHRDSGNSICFCGDNLQTVQWINGLWQIKTIVGVNALHGSKDHSVDFSFVTNALRQLRSLIGFSTSSGNRTLQQTLWPMRDSWETMALRLMLRITKPDTRNILRGFGMVY